MRTGLTTAEASVHWMVEGWPEDVVRGIASFDRHHDAARLQHVVVDPIGLDPRTWPGVVEVVHPGPDVGWAAGRNAGLGRAAGDIVMVVDGSIEVTGDVLAPLAGALQDPSVGLTGPFGIVTDDLREFQPSSGPDVDAIEGYLMAFRRDRLADGVAFDDGFRFYRMADVDFSLRVKSLGLRVVVTPVPVVRHPHRTWESTPEEMRGRLSKRNFYRFLDRWRGRTDLLVNPGERGSPGAPGEARSEGPKG